jgi:glycosyltransferase involved in cell wall biosynthesis
MAEAAVHCLPSRPQMREGMASVVLEAKSAATPSVVSRHGSLPELVRHGVDGWIADDTPAALADGLRHFLASSERRDEAGAAALASLQRFSSEQFAAQWRKVFGLQDVIVPHSGTITGEPLSR